MIINPEIQAGLDKLTRRNGAANAVLASGALAIGNWRSPNRANRDFKLETSRLLTNNIARKVVLEGLISVIERTSPDVDVICGISSFGSNAGQVIAEKLDLPYVNLIKEEVGGIQRLHVPSRHQDVLAEGSHMVIVKGFVNGQDKGLLFDPVREKYDIEVSPVVLWSNQPDVFDLPGHFLGDKVPPKPLVQHYLPNIITN